MEDQGYARRLFAILTNPFPAGIDPPDPYGAAEDGIDRRGGFGRDVWVEAVHVADGEYGAELVVEFGLELDSAGDARVPPRGSVRLPFDAQWRERSGYLNPGAYAPDVARKVEMAAFDHVERHRSHPPRQHERDQDQALLPSRAKQWQMLLDALRRMGTVEQVAPGRIELHHLGTVVTVVVSANQWEQVMIDQPWGVDLYFDELLGPRQEDETFVVFYHGDLARSTQETPPPVRGRAWESAIEEARAEDPNGQFSWDASPPEVPRQRPRT